MGVDDRLNLAASEMMYIHKRSVKNHCLAFLNASAKSMSRSGGNPGRRPVP
jgi:hypothetical protein